MIIEQALTAYLEAKAEVAAVIGARIYSLRLPQEPDLPAIKYDVLSIERSHLIDFAWATIQYTLVAETHLGVRQLADVIRAALQRERRIMSGVSVEQIALTEEVGPMLDPDLGAYYVQQVYQVNYREV